MKKYIVQKTVDSWVVKEDKSDTVIATFHDSPVTDAKDLARDLSLKLNNAERRDNFDECYERLSRVSQFAHDLYEGVNFLKKRMVDNKDTLDISVTCDSDDFIAAYLYDHFDKLCKAVEEMPKRELIEDAFNYKNSLCFFQ